MPVPVGALVIAVVHVAAALVGLLVGLGLLRGRATATARGFAVALLGGAAWSTAAAAGVLAGTAARQVLYAGVVVPSVAVAVAGFACGVYALARVDWVPSRRALLLLAAHPVTVLVLGATNPWHHLVVRDEVGDTANGLVFGPLFVAHSVVAYAILGGVGVIAVLARRAAPALRSRQLTLVVAMGALPGVGTGLQLALLPGLLLDLGAVTFVVVGIVDAYLIFRLSALSTLPVARSTVLETIGDGILVLDDGDVVVDANAAALELLAERDEDGQPRIGSVVGRPVTEMLGPAGAPPPGLAAAGARRRIELPGGTAVADVRWAPIRATFGGTLGSVVVVRDVTADVARETALAVANAELREHLVTIELLRQEVAEQAVRDAVTGLHNRRRLDVVLAERLEAATDDGASLALAIIDADRFKQVNDQHGHAAGDRVLESLAGALTAGVAESDVLVRYGGEEFVVLMSGVDEATAVGRLERLRASCAGARVPIRGGHIGVTVSAGLAFAGPARTTPESLLDAADRALYEAKRSGRDRVCVAAPAHVGVDAEALVHQRAGAGGEGTA